MLVDIEINYPGGWVRPKNEQCVNICKNSKSTPTCFTNSTDCLSKKQRPGDYDNVQFDQLFLPQFCRDLLAGYDTTMSHRPVAKFPTGISCLPNRVSSRLTIHGLWPNYRAGFPSCCNVSDVILNHPYDPFKFEAKYPDLFNQIALQWIDPTQATTHDALCELFNHEFQKHGLCFSANASDYEASAYTYFSAIMQVADHLNNETTQINHWAKSKTAIFLDDIQALYSKSVHVYCSTVSNNDSNQLSAIRTCWSKSTASPVQVGPQVDCGAPSLFGPVRLCLPHQPINLDSYHPPAP